MGYEEYSREEYRAECACGKGYTRYYKKYMYNDWGQTKEKTTPVEIICEHCKDRYHFQPEILDTGYLVPNGEEIPTIPPQGDGSYNLDKKEKCVDRYSLAELQEIYDVMVASKIRWIKQFRNSMIFNLADITGTKTRKQLVAYIEEVITDYDKIKEIVDEKNNKRKIFAQQVRDWEKGLKEILIRSKEIEFKLIVKTDSKKHKEIQEQHKKYFLHNKKGITYLPIDLTCEKDFTGLYWDTYHIKEDKEELYATEVKCGFKEEDRIVKGYSCVCTMCGNEEEFFSTDFKIEKDDEKGYYSVPCCNCHTPSSAEAKTMDILNKLGVIYMREKSFENLQGELGGELRFDFAFYKKGDEDGNTKIDLVIELQGPHHYKPGYYDKYGNYITEDLTIEQKTKAEEDFAYQQRKDQKKQDYCKNNGIVIECINLETKSDYEYLKKKIIKILDKNKYEYLD